MALDRKLFVELLRVELLPVVLLVLAQRPRDVLHVVQNAFGIVIALRERILEISLARRILLDFQQLGHVLLQALHLLLQVVYLLINDVECSQIVLSVLNLDLNQQLVVLAILCELLRLVKGLILLAAYLDRGVDIKDGLGLVLTLRSVDELCDLVFLLQLDVAVEEQRRVVLVVITHCIETLHA